MASSFTSPPPHALSAGQRLIDKGQSEQNPGAERHPEQRALPAEGRIDGGKADAQHYAGQADHIRDDLVVEVDTADDHQGCAQHEKSPGWAGSARSGIQSGRSTARSGLPHRSSGRKTAPRTPDSDRPKSHSSRAECCHTRPVGWRSANTATGGKPRTGRAECGRCTHSKSCRYTRRRQKTRRQRMGEEVYSRVRQTLGSLGSPGGLDGPYPFDCYCPLTTQTQA